METMETTTKVCSKCKVEKPFDDFSRHKSRKDGRQPHCKECYKKYNEENSERKKELHKRWCQENADKIIKYCQENSDKRREQSKQWRQENADRIREYNKEWNQENYSRRREYSRQYHKDRKNSDPVYKMICNFRVRIYKYCNAIKLKKTSRTKEMLGINLIGFKFHIESKFQEGMSWENYGQWHVDHIKPLSLATNEQEIIELNHYTNLQPLWAVDNLKKSNKYEESH